MFRIYSSWNFSAGTLIGVGLDLFDVIFMSVRIWGTIIENTLGRWFLSVEGGKYIKYRGKGCVRIFRGCF